MPLVNEALARLERELQLARTEGVRVLKLVHGYGSTGKGGDIRIAVQKTLVEKQQSAEILAVIFGEDWRRSHELTWELLRKIPELKSDIDLGRANQGITVVVLK